MPKIDPRDLTTYATTLLGLENICAEARRHGLPDDAVVIIAKDSEGNDFSPLADADHDCAYRPESTYSGDVEHYDEDNVEDEPDPRTWSEWYADALDDGCLPCVVLWPTN